MSNAALALAVANARYWSGVAPLTHTQLRRWEYRARAIPDPTLRAIALTKLQAERFNAEVAATLATLAPRRERARAVEAIVALEVMYDYLDALTERLTADPLRAGRQLFTAFTDALDPGSAQTGDYFRHHPSDDGGYLAALSETTSAALARLPAWNAVSEAALRSARRCGEAQVRVHAVPLAGAAQLREWTTAQAAGTALEWREFMAGAVSSVLAVHALIGAATDIRTTHQQAAAIDSAYLSLGALSTMLDSVIDYEQDNASGEAWFMLHYDSRAALADRIAAVLSDAREQVQTLPNAAHHKMTLVGVVAYYTSAQEATRGIAAPLTQRVHAELGALMAPTLAVMRAWRGAKRLRQMTTGRHRATSSTRADANHRAAPSDQRLTATAHTT